MHLTNLLKMNLFLAETGGVHIRSTRGASIARGPSALISKEARAITSAYKEGAEAPFLESQTKRLHAEFVANAS